MFQYSIEVIEQLIEDRRAEAERLRFGRGARKSRRHRRH